MKFANVNGQRQKAEPGLSGVCPACGSPMVAKCGEIRDKHWAHRTKCIVDVWWENESEWHRAWKSHFPESWQEIVHHAENGAKHIADVKTDDGWVIEFQRSRITPDERHSRDAFYKKLIWVVDGTRSTRDTANFTKLLQAATPITGNPDIRRVRADECRLVQEWSGSPKLRLVFFDFGHEQPLWWLLAGRHDEPMYVGHWSRVDFIAAAHGKGPERSRNFHELLWRLLGTLLQDYARLYPQVLAQPAVQPIVSPQYLVGRKFRF
jgi:competence protein CoiA